jgi:hypothetical protein
MRDVENPRRRATEKYTEVQISNKKHLIKKRQKTGLTKAKLLKKVFYLWDQKIIMQEALSKGFTNTDAPVSNFIIWVSRSG